MEEIRDEKELEGESKIKDRKSFVDIINYKIFIIIIITFSSILFLDLVIERVQLEFSTILLTIDIICLFITIYYLIYFIKFDLYPKFMEKINLPNKIKSEIDEKLFDKKTIIIAGLIDFTIFTLFFIISYDYIIVLTKTLVFFIMTIVVFILLAVEILEAFLIAFSLIIKIIHYREEFTYTIGHEDNMGGSRGLIEIFYKNIYPLFLIIIIIVAILSQVTYGNIIIFNNLLPFDVQLIGIVILITAITIVLLAISVTQVLNHQQMMRFKKKTISQIEKKIKKLQDKIQTNNPDLKIRVEQLSQITILQFEKENVEKMKTVLITGSLIKKLVISFLGIIISYVFNSLLRFLV